MANFGKCGHCGNYHTTPNGDCQEKIVEDLIKEKIGDRDMNIKLKLVDLHKAMIAGCKDSVRGDKSAITKAFHEMDEKIIQLRKQVKYLKNLAKSLKGNPFCRACKEPDCLVSDESGDCEMIRVYREAKNGN